MRRHIGRLGRTGIEMKRVGFVISLLLFSATLASADFQTGLAAYNSRNFEKAVSIWEADGALGDFNAQYNLGVLFEQGVDGVPKDLSKAYAWYRLAAAQNVDAANVAIGRLKPILTSGQIEDGNKLAIGVLGKWYRNNIGQDEQEYQKILAKRETQ
ncbi:MAG: sel1 repeat family protein, partial [Sneathiella sp.]|nr:sel1 repeat family protein [Sneathiella sp.]